MDLTTALLALLAFQVKHFLCDFALQTRWQVEAKGHYGRAGGLVHAGLHGLLSVPALLIVGPPAWLIALIPAGEFVLHYHIDWAKMAVDRRAGWTPDRQPYWIVFGVDQMLHQLTYLGILALLA